VIDISFIVSHCDRPVELRCCLYSILQQKVSKEIIVCDNSEDVGNRLDTRHLCGCLEGVRYQDTHATVNNKTCYHGMEVKPEGKWLCWPSDDSYYVPLFANIMLGTAEKNGWDAVICDVLYDPRLAYCRSGGKTENEYSVLYTRMIHGHVDKTCMMVKADLFAKLDGWPNHKDDWKDGELACAIVRSGAPWGKAPGPMVVHN
jgi:hypothetical protein